MSETVVHPLRPSRLRLGRSERSPAPKIKLRDFVDIEKAAAKLPVAVEQEVDYAHLVPSWPMFGNDKLRDCTCAAAGHAKQVFDAMVGQPCTVDLRDIERMYEAAGWDPTKVEPNGENPTDQGWTLDAAAEYLRGPGLQGEPDIDAFAGVSLTDEDEQQVARELFGGTYEGMECPQSALQEAQEGKPWVVVKDSPIAGGHCVYRPKNILASTGYYVSWGALIPATLEFEKEYIDEIKAFVPHNWEAKLPEAILELGIVDFSKLASLAATLGS